MSTVTTLISDIREALESQIDPEQLLPCVRGNQVVLKSQYELSPRDFSDDQVAFLNSLDPLCQWLEEFQAFLEAEVDESVTAAVPQFKIDEINRIIPRLEPYKIAQHARFIRKSYAGREPVDWNTAHHQMSALAQEIQRHAPKCSCGHSMIVRFSDYGPFWGCTNFPSCMRKKKLDDDDAARFNAL